MSAPAAPAVAPDGTIYIGNGGGFLMLWDYPTGRRMFSSPAIGADGSLYVASDSLYAFKP